jgi:hypothetical protein
VTDRSNKRKLHPLDVWFGMPRGTVERCGTLGEFNREVRRRSFRIFLVILGGLAAVIGTAAFFKYVLAPFL